MTATPGDVRAPGAGTAVVVLAGGGARRFGSDKLAAVVGGRTLLDALLTTLPPAWPVVAVGPERRTERPVTWTREQPPGGGPLAGVEAGLARVTEPVVVVIAGDMPDAARALGALRAALLESPPETVGAVATDPAGVANPLLAAYRTEALRDGTPRPAAGRAARALLDLPHVRVPVDPVAARDVDTPADLPAGQGRGDGGSR
ncbi:MAG: molybdenum cofactor guanylyltransferase [Dermatophilaceae bacterium]